MYISDIFNQKFTDIEACPQAMAPPSSFPHQLWLLFFFFVDISDIKDGLQRPKSLYFSFQINKDVVLGC